MNSWPLSLLAYLEAGQSATLVMIANVRGSSPRDKGAFMIVSHDSFIGTIGGGALEYQALQIARAMMTNSADNPFQRQWRDIALGPNLGQCCGGHVTLLFECYAPSMTAEIKSLSQARGNILHDASSDEMPQITDEAPHQYQANPRRYNSAVTDASDNLYIYGAGHVGRALIEVTGGLGLRRVWVDDDKARFPEAIAADVEAVVAKDMGIIAQHAPPNSYHIILTYSHQIDEEIVKNLLVRGAFLQLGLIGSLTKAARFKSRFQKEGLSDEMIERMICPIGLADITSKKPAHVALSIAGQIASWCEKR